MKQICISSEVQSIYMLIDYITLPDILAIRLRDLDENLAVVQIPYEVMMELKIELENRIDNIISNRSVTQIQRAVEIPYKKVILRLDYRNAEDYRLSTFLSIYDMVLSCEALKGGLFIYNRDLFEKYQANAVIAYLRVNFRLSKQEIQDGITALWRQSSVLKNKIFEQTMLNMALEHLKEHGMVSYSAIDSKYSLTARGYMFYG